MKVQNGFITSLELQGEVIAFMLDLSVAFGTIDHDILFSKMENALGIAGPALAWFRSYHWGRTLRIKIDKSFTRVEDILWSVPKGAVLGPLLFLSYLLPLGNFNKMHDLELRVYAEDIELCLSIKPSTQHEVDIDC